MGSGKVVGQIPKGKHVQIPRVLRADLFSTGTSAIQVSLSITGLWVEMKDC